MAREIIQDFIRSASADLESVRRNLLLIAQTGAPSDGTKSHRALERVRAEASLHGFAVVAAECSDCQRLLDAIKASPASFERSAFKALDCLSRIDAALFEIPIDDTAEIDALVNTTLGEIVQDVVEPAVFAQFEIDEETLEVFRDEANDLLTNITRELFVLSERPGDQNALWSIRRHAHTFKGSAGIVGLHRASAIAHRMEDMLDKMVEMGGEAVPQVFGFLVASVQCLESVVAAKAATHDDQHLDDAYEAAIRVLSSLPRAGDAERPVSNEPEPARAVRPTTTSIVRVSLDRLDDLIGLSQAITLNWSAFAEHFAHFEAAPAMTEKLERLLAVQKERADEMHAKLLRIRLVRFGTLETRFARAVNATCLDANKKAAAVVENGEVEIDTQTIDALIEPLLHLIKNAVVHGIEPPDTRRMIGKPERGTVRIRLKSDARGITLAVSDDGGGISAPRLKAKAIAAGVIDEQLAAAMDDEQVAELIFERGLTTADHIDLNAGRGVGMSIVKEAVESRGGTVSIDSQPHIGTTFTIQIPQKSLLSSSSSLSSLNNNKFNELQKLVLIVDDSASVRRHNTKLAEEVGMRVITAANGAEALELLLSGAHEPDLILSDIEMPQIDGWELLEYLKTDVNLGHIPVVMVSSLDDGKHRERALSLGAADYHVKPLSKDALAKYVLEASALARH